MKLPHIHTTTPGSRPRLIAALAATGILLVLAGVGVYGLATGPSDSSTADSVQSSPAITVTPSPSSGRATSNAPSLPALAASTDPETFARSVAQALFTWDTGSGLIPMDYTSVVLAAGDPSGVEQAGLASDIATYLPSREQWISLREYATTQSLTIDSAVVPSSWRSAVDQDTAGQLTAGTTAYTIRGARHRTGTWNNQSVTSEHPVAFTVFIVCAPTYDTCHLLRLSELDNPLT